jgi:hypothetical protein
VTQSEAKIILKPKSRKDKKDAVRGLIRKTSLFLTFFSFLSYAKSNVFLYHLHSHVQELKKRVLCVQFHAEKSHSERKGPTQKKELSFLVK